MPIQTVRRLRARLRSNKEVDLLFDMAPRNRRYRWTAVGVESGRIEVRSPGWRFATIDEARAHAEDYCDVVGE